MSRAEILVLIVERMREAFEVRRIILFGSQARGTATEDSDYDVLVEVESDLPFFDRQQVALRALGKRSFAVDLIVLTPSEFSKQAGMLGSSVDWALSEGICLYTREEPAK